MLYFLLALALAALFGPQWWARQVMATHGRREYFSGTGLELARLLLDRCRLIDVSVEATPLPDHYDPASRTVRLNATRCGRRSLTAVVVAAHEVGHAIQHHTAYPPFMARTRLVLTAARLEKAGAAIMMAVPLLAVVTRVPAAGLLMLVAGLATLCVPLVIHLLTLPAEFDASFRRALPMLQAGGYIPMEDLPAARRILRACALTYAANALAGLLNIWRWLRVLRR